MEMEIKESNYPPVLDPNKFCIRSALCEKCKGIGDINGNICSNCEGTGNVKVIVPKITKESANIIEQK